jgi:hypothetical protein
VRLKQFYFGVLPNELRIDAAERQGQMKGVRAAASIRVERSRTPEHIKLLEIKTQGQGGKSRPNHYLRQSKEELYRQKERFCRGKKS